MPKRTMKPRSQEQSNLGPENQRANLTPEDQRMMLEEQDNLPEERELDVATAAFVDCLEQTGLLKKFQFSEAQLNLIAKWRTRQIDYYTRRHQKYLEEAIDWSTCLDTFEPIDWRKIVEMVGQLVCDIGNANAAELFSTLTQAIRDGQFGGWTGRTVTPVRRLLEQEERERYEDMQIKMTRLARLRDRDSRQSNE